MKKFTTGKAKKQQIKNARAAKRKTEDSVNDEISIVSEAANAFRGATWYDPTNLQTAYKERATQDEVTKQKIAASAPIKRSEMGYYKSVPDLYREVIDIPIRPSWKPSMTKVQVEKNEEAYFSKYIHNIYTKYATDRLNFFEQNLGVWRQFWRTCEKSDLLVVVADARYPAFHLPPSLYRYVTTVCKKPFVLALNKIDLISHDVLERWLAFFRSEYPLLTVVPFTSHAISGTITFDQLNEFKETKRKLATRSKPQPFGVEALVHTWDHLVEKLLAQKTDLPSTEAGAPATEPKTKESKTADEDAHEETDDDDDEEEVDTLAKGTPPQFFDEEPSELTEPAPESQPEIALSADEKAEPVASHLVPAVRAPKAIKPSDNSAAGREAALIRDLRMKKQAQKDAVTIGMIGHPNVGKSSIINALCGRYRVGVSATPGHTKHIQTIALNDTVQLCDCPGLVFPAVDMPKSLQILCGLFPLAQVREPYTTIQYLAEIVPLEKIYGLKPPTATVRSTEADALLESLVIDEDTDDRPSKPKKTQKPAQVTPNNYRWSGMSICEALATQKQFRTHQGQLDTYRAAHFILDDVLRGEIALYFEPPTQTV